MNLVLWRQQAEIAQKYLRKGSKIYAEGKLQTRSWDDKQTGAKRYATDVVVDHFIMLDTRGPNADGGWSAGAAGVGTAGAERRGNQGNPQRCRHLRMIQIYPSRFFPSILATATDKP